MATLTHIDELIRKERDLSNTIHDLDRTFVKPSLITDLTKCQSELQETIEGFLPEWMPGESCGSHFYKYPEHKQEIKKTEQMLTDCLMLFKEATEEWADVTLKRNYSKTDALLLEESFEVFVTVDEFIPSDKETGTVHKIIRMKDVWAAMHFLQGVVESEVVEADYLPYIDLIANGQTWKKEDLIKLRSMVKHCRAQFLGKQWKDPDFDQTNIVAQICMFGEIRYPVQGME